MAQVTIYLDDALAEQMRSTVKAKKSSQSRWISGLIKQALSDEWSPQIVALAGSWQDFPSLTEIRASMGEDSERESL